MADKRRDKGTGSFRQRSNGRWEGRYKGKTCSGSTEAEMKRNLKALIQKMDNEKALGLNPKDIVFSEWADTWMSEYKKISLRPTSYHAYSSNISIHIKPVIGHLKLSMITPDHIQSIFVKMTEDGLKPASVVKVKNIIHSVLEQAVKNRYIPYNPSNATIPPKVEHEEIRVFNLEEQQHFLNVLRGNRLEALFLTALGTGLRRGELLALSWDNIDFEKKEITVTGSLSRVDDESRAKGTILALSMPKTKSGRRKIPIIENIEAVLHEHKQKQQEERKSAGYAWNPNNLVFCSTVGTYIEPRRLNQCLDKILKKAELDHINFHALRHTFATRMIERGASIKALQKILGHADATLTLNTYAHILDSTAHEEIQKIDSLFSPF